ncbi:AMP-binding protein [Sorangium sp. So ce295]|jgi:hypothetical protein|uniref:AMP-binding protein n=1 Tax=Sorangium sp. So ce295 TaxID=3133295 RepID=UPI003F619C0E
MPAPDLVALLRSLDLAREDETPDLTALSATWEDPPAFRRALLSHSAQRTGPLRSVAGAAYDLYADAVLRHASSDRLAFIEIAPRADPVRLRFSELHARASALAAAWSGLGVKPKAAIAIVVPAGAVGVVAFAAALYLGARVSWILPCGDVAVAHALKALAPEHVVVDPRSPAPVGKLIEKALPVSAPARRPTADPVAYPPKSPCIRALSPLRGPFGRPVDVAAETALCGALSDGMLGYRLSPGDRLSAPGFHHEQSFLPLLLSAWLSGAAFVQLPEEHLLSTPSALSLEPITVLGLSPAFASSLRAAPRPMPSSLKALFRSVCEPLDWLEVRDALKKNDLGKVPVFNVLIDTAAGGTVLSGARRPAGVSAKALPSPGVAWDLVDAATKKPTPGGAGVFLRRGDDLGEDGYFLLARTGNEYLWGGTLEPRRSARAFPGEALSGEVNELPFAQGAAVVPLAGAGPRGDTRIALCVFTGGRAVEPGFAEAIAKLVRERLGPDWRPDTVEIFSLFGRGKGGKTDARWCSTNYLAGRLHARERDGAIRRLGELRRGLSSIPAVVRAGPTATEPSKP